MDEKEKNKLCGGTTDIAETIIDYKKGKTEIKGVPENTLINRVKSAFIEYIVKLSLPSIILVGIVQLILKYTIGYTIKGYTIKIERIIMYYFILVGLLSIFHINKKFDYKVKKYFAVKTGAKKRNKIKISNLNSKELVLYNFRNIVLDYEAKGDVAKKLNKIWIKQEHLSSMISRQGNISDMMYLDNEPIWNAHFIFDSVPKDGYLYIEWI